MTRFLFLAALLCGVLAAAQTRSDIYPASNVAPTMLTIEALDDGGYRASVCGFAYSEDGGDSRTTCSFPFDVRGATNVGRCDALFAASRWKLLRAFRFDVDGGSP